MSDLWEHAINCRQDAPCAHQQCATVKKVMLHMKGVREKGLSAPCSEGCRYCLMYQNIKNTIVAGRQAERDLAQRKAQLNAQRDLTVEILRGVKRNDADMMQLVDHAKECRELHRKCTVAGGGLFDSKGKSAPCNCFSVRSLLDHHYSCKDPHHCPLCKELPQDATRMRPPCFWPEMTSERGPNNPMRIRGEQQREELEKAGDAKAAADGSALSPDQSGAGEGALPAADGNPTPINEARLTSCCLQRRRARSEVPHHCKHLAGRARGVPETPFLRGHRPCTTRTTTF